MRGTWIPGLWVRVESLFGRRVVGRWDKGVWTGHPRFNVYAGTVNVLRPAVLVQGSHESLLPLFGRMYYGVAGMGV